MKRALRILMAGFVALACLTTAIDAATLLHRKQGEQFFDSNGDPLAGGKVYYYEAGTSNLQTTYSDSSGSTANTNPIILDSAGRLTVPVYFGDTASFTDYKEDLNTSADVAVSPWPFDDIPAAEPEDSGALFASPRFSWTQVTSAASPVSLAASDAGNAYEADTTSGSIEFDLPSAASVGDGKGFVFKKTASANSIIIDQNGTQTIDDDATALTITNQYEIIGIFSNGAEWYKVIFFTPDSFVGTSGSITRSAVATVNSLVITNNSSTPTTSVDIDADNALLVDTSGTGIRTGAVDLTIDATGTGANGLDTGSLANDTWYYIFLINNGSTTASLMSTSATSPTMPAGYTYKYRVGAIRTGGSATFIRILQVGNRTQYEVVTSSTTPNLPIMISGTSGSVSTPTWTAVATGDYVPTTAIRIFGTLGTSAGGGGDQFMVAPNNNYGAENSSSNPPPLHMGWASGAEGTAMYDFVLESTNIYYASASSNAYLLCMGWVDAVNAN